MSLKTLLPTFLYNFKKLNIVQTQHLSKLHTGNCLQKAEDRKEMLASLPAKDEGTAGERSVDIDTLLNK